MLGDIMWTLFYVIFFPPLGLLMWSFFNGEKSNPKHMDTATRRIWRLKYFASMALVVVMFVVAMLGIWTDLDWVDLFI